MNFTLSCVFILIKDNILCCCFPNENTVSKGRALNRSHYTVLQAPFPTTRKHRQTAFVELCWPIFVKKDLQLSPVTFWAISYVPNSLRLYNACILYFYYLHTHHWNPLYQGWRIYGPREIFDGVGLSRIHTYFWISR